MAVHIEFAKLQANIANYRVSVADARQRAKTLVVRVTHPETIADFIEKMTSFSFGLQLSIRI
ncbi:hypothetical protein ACIGEI_16145 [Pseudomonas sp. NPDC078863]|jgi:hypothetical protein|uniref:hypothetical protein n=1 Tax=unclassified Pseudomonas TaxID=196821 RepID=UPI0028AB0AE4|nr:hypothetical protein [Pseudomonas sp.]